MNVEIVLNESITKECENIVLFMKITMKKREGKSV